MKLRQTLFWDTNPDKIDLEKNAQYIIERILDFGHDDEVRWMRKFYDHALIKRVVEKSRSLRPDTKKLWTLLLQNV
ncbi:MAG: hypothetical protein A3G52_00700 [Candidatus Taylorbacteria bacterium RIFCSPLOWO2_12_FULL_43_20]|uniref:DUF6922 domain-containing protein n=1 Tax=Candidatus Taylorbacteria bacterium RIFCSPLOWO2_12_FULL_43_20 TaxID=1802332 RepID=A0A1G2P207_9BACT|nr:MAG: hypothetical protein A3B98_01125 [Candidatus Taylorbacteria bacterium RIFCSPHIGHO2_02_FULL_43_55]OHA29599.1 MAG: hypothetical protein A3E92_04055 [Candidatus Taylorbacteria bacterium RIFCSPHIGHO2_12_FULL_42_34]OHA37584.1 MAG: hypothetical protein A3H58_02060 [Candidatus Taylorbacteria bacterium RIFCSPLOWO2_02_FULL_43_22b]OHA41611.1 MAG: hypothetical protein A3G52_00700 [Candidatus Taylorbacteria bacterium RIFCSPLOWO2_12_FULL_43_20]HKZ42493.1 hypothetical protein [Candidatus Hodarchaeale